MKITKNSVVSIRYELKDIDGKILESSVDPVDYLLGGYDTIFPKVEQAMMGKTIGDSINVDLQPDDAFGDYDKALVQLEPANAFPAEMLKVGMQFEGEDETGDIILYTVTDIVDGQVVVDGNHAAAGERLIFSATIMKVRMANNEEIKLEHVQRHYH